MTATEESALLLIAETIAKAVNECGGTLDHSTAYDYAHHLFEQLHLSHLLVAARVLDDRDCWTGASLAITFSRK